LIGDPDDTFDVMLYLIHKDRPKDMLNLNKLKGNVGDNVNAGYNKKIVWNVLDNQFDTHNEAVTQYYFLLEID